MRCSGRGDYARGRGRGFESHRPRSREFYAKNAATCDGRALAGGALPQLKKYIFFQVFFVSTFAEWKSIYTGGSKATACAVVLFPSASSADGAGKRQWKWV
jgi:hypothetical protein